MVVGTPFLETDSSGTTFVEREERGREEGRRRLYAIVWFSIPVILLLININDNMKLLLILLFMHC
jgi:hypothetical protein